MTNSKHYYNYLHIRENRRISKTIHWNLTQKLKKFNHTFFKRCDILSAYQIKLAVHVLKMVTWFFLPKNVKIKMDKRFINLNYILIFVGKNYFIFFILWINLANITWMIWHKPLPKKMWYELLFLQPRTVEAFRF